MKTFITAWPIDKPFQQKLGIYENGYVKSISIGRVLTTLADAGYTEISSFVEQREGYKQLTIHCARKRDAYGYIS